MTRNPQPAAPRPLTRLHALVATVVAGAALVWIAGFLTPGIVSDAPAAWRLLLVAAVIVAGDVAVLHLKFGRDQYTFTWSEASVLIGLVLVPWPYLSLVAPVAVAAAHLARRRSLMKVLFNAASIAIGTTLARLVCGSIVGDRQVHEITSVQTWLALSAAAVVYFLWNSLTVSAAIALSLGMPFREVATRGVPLKLAVLAGNTMAALLLVTSSWEGSTIVLVPFSVVLLYVSYRGYLRAMEERDVWRQLDDSTDEIDQLDELSVAAAAVERAAQLFKADTVELVLLDEDAQPTAVLVHDEDGLHEAAHAHDLGGTVAYGDAVRTIRIEGADVTWLVVPLNGLDRLLGSLRLGFRGPLPTTERDQQVLSTFRHSVRTSLQNARLYGEMRAQAELSAHEAAHDALTGLANRNLLRTRAEAAIAQAAADGSVCALLLLDLDHFKVINDTLGHGAGDDLLRAVADRLAHATRPIDTIARLGGDEFAVLLCDLPSVEAADAVARQLLRVLAEPVVQEGLRLVVEGSIGVACFPDDGTDVKDLMRRADVALYQAKESRGSFAHYRSDRDESSVDRLTVVAELRNALANDELVIHFQPQVDLATGEIDGVEVLTRWQHPVRGLLGPGEFVDIAEHSGLVREFTLHILERGVIECAAWAREGAPVRLAVNLSARNLLDPALPSDVAAILHRHGLPPEQLVLEITETVMMSQLDVVEQVLAGLRALGVELSVDDFGTGYSSLAFLKRVAVNEIKIDRSFVSQMLDEGGDAAIVQATLGLARSLGLRVVAEGVETVGVAQALTALGCDVGQGYHFARPGDTTQMRALLKIGGLRALPTPRLPEASRVAV